MNKRLFLMVLVVLVLLTGCGNKLSKDVINQRNKFIDSLGVTSDERIIVRNKKKNQYYEYIIVNNNSYKSYLYILHNSKEEYEKYISEKENTKYYELKKYDNSLITRVNYLSGYARDNENIRDEIISNFNKGKKYVIIY